MSRIQILRQDDFTGGLNLRADQFQLAPNESPKMLNVEIDPRGGVFSRGGMRQVNAAPIIGAMNLLAENNNFLVQENDDNILLESIDLSVTPWQPHELFPFYRSTPQLMLSASDGVYYSTGSNFINAGIATSQTYGASFAQWAELLYVACGVDTASKRWNGSAVTTLTSPVGAWVNDYTTPNTGLSQMPQANHAVTHAGKLWVANTKEGSTYYPNRIRWSHPNLPTNWASSDFIDINDGGDGITAIATIAGHLVVFKERAVFAIFGYDSSSFQVVEVTNKVGAVHSQAVASTERGIYFFSWSDGLMVYDGRGVYDLFEPLRPIIAKGKIDYNSIDVIYVNVINRRIWLSLPYTDSTAADPTTVFVYDPSIGKGGAYTMFSTSDGFGVAGGCDFINSGNQSYGMAAHPDKPHVLRVDDYSIASDNIVGVEEAFDSYYRTRWIDGGAYVQKKMFRRPEIVVKQPSIAQSLEMKVYHDYEEAEGNEARDFVLSLEAASGGGVWNAFLWGAGNWGFPSEGASIARGKNMGLARAIQLEVTGPDSQAWGIDSVTFKYNPRRIRG